MKLIDSSTHIGTGSSNFSELELQKFFPSRLVSPVPRASAGPYFRIGRNLEYFYYMSMQCSFYNFCCLHDPLRIQRCFVIIQVDQCCAILPLSGNCSAVRSLIAYEICSLTTACWLKIPTALAFILSGKSGLFVKMHFCAACTPIRFGCCVTQPGSMTARHSASEVCACAYPWNIINICN